MHFMNAIKLKDPPRKKKENRKKKRARTGRKESGAKKKIDIPFNFYTVYFVEKTCFISLTD